MMSGADEKQLNSREHCAVLLDGERERERERKRVVTVES
jgi:hypothetical protein